MTSTTFFIIFIPILSVILLAVNLLLAPHNPYQEKDSVFECGYHSFSGQNRTEFSVSFFVFGLLFLLFDLQIVLIYPYSVSSYSNDSYGLGTMLLFFGLLTLGFIFELGKGALFIDSRQTSLSNNNNTPNLDSYIILRSSIFDLTIKIIIKFLWFYVAKLFHDWMELATTHTRIFFTTLLAWYPFMYKYLDTIFTYLAVCHFHFSMLLENTCKYLMNKYPVYYYIAFYIYSEYLSLLRGNISNQVWVCFTFYLIYDFNLYTWCIYFLLLSNDRFKLYLDRDIWIELEYPKIKRVLIWVNLTFSLILVSLFLEHIYIETILPAIKYMLSYILKSAGLPNPLPDQDLSKGEGPQSPKDPNDGATAPLKTDEKKKPRRSKKNKTPEEKFEIELEKLYARLKEDSKKYYDIENKHDHMIELKETLPAFTTKYQKWLSKEEKDRLNSIYASFKKLELNQQKGEGMSAPNVLTYWKLIKEDAKNIQKTQNKITELFEKNSKKIQKDNLGGTNSEKSLMFRNDLNELKEVYTSYYKIKEQFLNNQLNKSSKIDSMLKAKGITVKELCDKNILN